jgi:hypothetical protein
MASVGMPASYNTMLHADWDAPFVSTTPVLLLPLTHHTPFPWAQVFEVLAQVPWLDEDDLEQKELKGVTQVFGGGEGEERAGVTKHMTGETQAEQLR